ncbi:MAG: hypothetical protein AAF707_09560, partial [Pseudomonadota bacterium]
MDIIKTRASWRRATFAVFSVVLLSIWPVSVAQETAQVPLDQPALVEALQEGGLVLLIRHERTEVPSRRDDYTKAPDDCTAQRNLSIAGAAGAQETGFSLRALEIPIGRVMTSPMCRSAETARFMFGVNYESDLRLMHHDPNGERTLDIAAEEVRALLSELAPGLPDSNIALVSHGGSIFRVSGLRLTEGEIGVLSLDETGTVVALGQLTGSDLGFLA